MKIKPLSLICILLLQGCAASFNDTFSEQLLTENKNIQDLSDVKQLPYIKYQRAFLGKKTVYSERQQAILEQRLSIKTLEPASLDNILTLVGAQTGISFKIDNSVPGDKNDGLPTMDDSHNIHFTGSFSEFIRYISALYDVDLELTDENILQAKLYSTYAINLDFYGENTTFESKIDLSGNEAASGGVSGKSETSFSSSFWDDVQDMAAKYLSTGVYSIFKDASILTFTARPSEYRVLQKVLNEYKQQNARQYVVSWMVFTLDKNKVKNIAAGISLDFLRGGTSFTINTEMLNQMGSGLAFNRKFYAGDDPRLNIGMQLEAIYHLTGNKVLQNGTFVTRNNTPIPLNLSNSQYFVSGRTVTMNDSFANTEVNTEEIITGTSFFITPRGLSDGRIEVASGFTKRILNSIDTFDDVQLPNVSSSEMLNTSVITPGSLVLVGRYDASQQMEQRGAMLLGGSFGQDITDNTVVMIVGIDNYRQPFAEQ